MTWREWLRYRALIRQALNHALDQGYPVSANALVLIKEQARRAVLADARDLTHTPVWVPNDRLAAVQAALGRPVRSRWPSSPSAADWLAACKDWAARQDAQPSNRVS